MIEPTRITNYDRTPSELQEFLLFGIAVAGKRSTQTRDALALFLEGRLSDETPFEYVARLEDGGRLGEELRAAKLSPYGTREAGFRAAALLGDLATVTVRDLEEIPGIGPKTSRFFILHTRRDVRHAVLDTHILAWLGERGHRVPKQTPQGWLQYRRLELTFLDECERRKMDPAAFDLAIWSERSRN